MLEEVWIHQLIHVNEKCNTTAYTDLLKNTIIVLCMDRGECVCDCVCVEENVKKKE